MPIFIHFPPLGTIIYWWELQTVMGDLSVHPKDPRQPLEKDPPDPHRHDVGLCGPVVIVEHHHSQHHTARHHHHDAVEVRAWKVVCVVVLCMLKDGKLYLSKEQRPKCLASFGRLC